MKALCKQTVEFFKLGCIYSSQWRIQEFCSGVGVQQIQFRTEDRENGDLGEVAS